MSWKLSMNTKIGTFQIWTQIVLSTIFLKWHIAHNLTSQFFEKVSQYVEKILQHEMKKCYHMKQPSSYSYWCSTKLFSFCLTQPDLPRFQDTSLLLFTNERILSSSKCWFPSSSLPLVTLILIPKKGIFICNYICILSVCQVTMVKPSLQINSAILEITNLSKQEIVFRHVESLFILSPI